jgi:hypothetical protein
VWAGVHYQAVLDSLSLGSFGRLSNFRPPATAAAPGLERLPVVQNTVLGLACGILILGLLASVALARRRRDLRYWAMACCPAVGLVAVALNPYGQEGVFRAVLFGLPWLAIMASDTISPKVLGSRLIARVAVAATVVCLTAAFLVSSFGLDGTNVIRPSDLRAVRHFEAAGGLNPPNLYFLLILNPGDQPTSPEPVGTRHFTWNRTLIDQPITEKTDFDARGEVRDLTRALLANTRESDEKAHLFTLWSPVGARYGEAYGVRSMRQSRALRDAFRSSSFWTGQSFGDGTVLFRFDRNKYVEGAE